MRFELGADPGLQSEAIASGKFESMISLAGANGMSRKREQPGSATGIGFRFDPLLKATIKSFKSASVKHSK